MVKNKRLKHRLELFVDKAIPYALVLLASILVIEFFFKAFAERILFLIHTLDWLIVCIFVVDLYFKYRRTKGVPNFLKSYWLEILAVFPFFLLFRLLELVGLLRLFGFVETFERGQPVLHEAVLLEQKYAGVVRGEKAAREAQELFAESERLGRFRRVIRPILRSPRLMMASRFFKEPKSKN